MNLHCSHIITFLCRTSFVLLLKTWQIFLYKVILCEMNKRRKKAKRDEKLIIFYVLCFYLKQITHTSWAREVFEKSVSKLYSDIYEMPLQFHLGRNSFSKNFSMAEKWRKEMLLLKNIYIHKKKKESVLYKELK